MRVIQNLPPVLLTLASSFALIACTNDTAPDSREPPSIPEDDVAYVDELVPHHEMATRMADEVIARGANGDVRAMAERMKAAQQEEIAILLSAREAVEGQRAVPPMVDPHMDADMAELRSLSGLELDRAFLRHMIPHHAGAVVTSHRAMPNLQRDDLRALAQMTVEMQTREAAEMLDKLESLGE